jgi:hypothetical protein
MFGQAKAAKKMLAQLPEVFRQVSGFCCVWEAADGRAVGQLSESIAGGLMGG